MSAYGSRPRVKGHLPVLPLQADGTVVQAAGSRWTGANHQGFGADLLQCDPLWATRAALLSQKRSPISAFNPYGAPPHTPFSGGQLQHDVGWGNTLKPSSRHVSLELKLRRGGGNGEKFYVIFAIVLQIRSC